MSAEREPRLSFQTLQVLQAFMERPQDGLAGADIRRRTGLASGTLYPILARLEDAGWLESQWEELDPHEVGRPRKRYYRITAIGARKTHRAFQQISLEYGNLAWGS